ncbi:hypothetical protein [Streptomyces sp. NPDC058045]|uniref:hypothetical protein n=1 Tax=Streptomyces sp. NPDC058045 TaxID=3346311 RepID=UPI0036E0ADC7
MPAGAAALLAAALLVPGLPGGGTAEAASLCQGRTARTLKFPDGTVRLYQRGDWVCAVTLARKPGTRRTMSVSVQARGSRAVKDTGRFVHHAGPVTVHAGHRCIRLGGSVSGHSAHTGWIRC